MTDAAVLQGLPPPGSVLGGKYEIGRVLGRGGMGLVVQARHLRMDRDVALKILLPALRSQPDVVARFEREGRAAAQLQDVHVARVLDVDTLPDGSPFMVMELLRGEDLADILTRRGKLPFRDAVGYVLEACAAMAEAHRAGIVHRDLKPNNLFVDKQGDRPVLKVLDFGISKVTGDVAASVTTTATAFGTPLYMSPEQVRSAKNVDARADIWSLGVVLYELLAGESPFAAPSATAILAAIIADKPTPIGDRRDDLPGPLADAVMRALEKDPAARFSDVQGFAAALAPFGPEGDAFLVGPALERSQATAPRPSVAPSSLAGAAAPAATNVPAARAARARQSLPLAPIALGLALALGGGAFVFFTVLRRTPPAAVRPEPQAPPPAAVLSTSAPTVAPAGSAGPSAIETSTAAPLPPRATPVEPPPSVTGKVSSPPVKTALPPATPPLVTKPAGKPDAPPAPTPTVDPIRL